MSSDAHLEARLRDDQDRFLVRISTRLVLDIMNQLSGLFDGDAIKGLVFIAFVQANVGHLDGPGRQEAGYDTLDSAPDRRVARPVRAATMSLALGIPRETMRRRVNALLGEGWLVEIEGGIVASPYAATRPEVIQAIVATSALVRRFHAACLAAGATDAPLAAVSEPPPHRAIVRVALAYVLRTWEEVRLLFAGDLIASLVFFAIADANTGHLLARSDRPHASVDDHVPDELRRPISALALSKATGLSRETARRHIRKLEAAGLCQQVKDGLVVPQAALSRTQVLESVGRNGRNVRLLLRRLRDVCAHGARAGGIASGLRRG